jgi:hypothetical protein
MIEDMREEVVKIGLVIDVQTLHVTRKGVAPNKVQHAD